MAGVFFIGALIMRGIFLYLLVLIAVIVGVYQQNAGQDNNINLATVTKADNSRVVIQGVARLGDQLVSVETYSGKTYQIHNLLTGAMEYDEFYQQGNWVIISEQGTRAALVSIMRMHVIFLLAIALCIALLFYAKKVGAKAILSFAGSILIIFELLIPGLVAGYSPIFITCLTVLALSSLIILSVAGWTTKGKSALAGTMIGLMVTTVLCTLVGEWMHIDGMNQPLAQPLFFEESMSLDMLGVFYAAVIIGASGAAMDVAMEMSATMEELKHHCPEIERKELLKSGIRVGNVVIGTMTTTLLLAYAGGFLTLMMLFVSRGNDLMQILNMKLVTSEMARILIGSLSLIIVAPITAYIASWMFTHQEMPQHKRSQLSQKLERI